MHTNHKPTYIGTYIHTCSTWKCAGNCSKLECAGNCSKLRKDSQVWAGGDARLARAETGDRHPLCSLRQGGAAARAA
eukprot:3566897-Prorocentrum_lima.AAC.1